MSDALEIDTSATSATSTASTSSTSPVPAASGLRKRHVGFEAGLEGEKSMATRRKPIYAEPDLTIDEQSQTKYYRYLGRVLGTLFVYLGVLAFLGHGIATYLKTLDIPEMPF